MHDLFPPCIGDKGKGKGKEKKAAGGAKGGKGKKGKKGSKSDDSLPKILPVSTVNSEVPLHTRTFMNSGYAFSVRM